MAQAYLFGATFILLAVSGCEQKPEPDKRTIELQQRLDSVTTALETMSKRVAVLESERADKGRVFLKPDDGVVGRLLTDAGTFFVLVDPLQSIEGGLLLTVHLGNPQSLAYRASALRVSWARSADESKPQTSRVAISGAIRSGWNPFDVYLAGATKEQAQVIGVELVQPVPSMDAPQ